MVFNNNTKVIAATSSSDKNFQPILFENIGTMVSSLSYLHSYIPLNLSSIEELIQNYQLALLPTHDKHFPLLNITKKYYKDMNRYYTNAAGKEVEVSPLTVKLWEEIVDVHIKEIEDLLVDIRTLKTILPTVAHEQSDIIQGQGKNFRHKSNPRPPRGQGHTPPPTSDEYPLYDFQLSSTPPPPTSTTIKTTTNKYKSPFKIDSLHSGSGYSGMIGRRRKRLVPLIIAGVAAGAGVLETSLGIYSASQINHLWSELNSQKMSISRLITVADAHDVHLRELDEDIRDTSKLVQSLFLFNPSLLTNRLLRIESQIKHRIMKAIHLIQQAQHRRLPIDYLTDSDVRHLFEVLVK